MKDLADTKELGIIGNLHRPTKPSERIDRASARSPLNSRTARRPRAGWRHPKPAQQQVAEARPFSRCVRQSHIRRGDYQGRRRNVRRRAPRGSLGKATRAIPGHSRSAKVARQHMRSCFIGTRSSSSIGRGHIRHDVSRGSSPDAPPKSNSRAVGQTCLNFQIRLDRARWPAAASCRPRLRKAIRASERNHALRSASSGLMSSSRLRMTPKLAIGISVRAMASRSRKCPR